MRSLRIGEVATRAGVAVDTVRYYERLGLLPTAPRRDSGYRVFDERAVERIRLVKQLQDIGLSLSEIEGMLHAVGDHGSSCQAESRRIEAALRRTEEKLAALTAMRTKLRRVLRRCARGECDLVEKVKQVS
jgi:DNA-binding transcriptional MerR regulator